MTTVTDAELEQHDAEKRQRRERAQWQVFLGIGVHVALMAIVYWFVSYEAAGTTMLALASALTLFAGTYLLIQDRRSRRAGVSGHAGLGSLGHLAAGPVSEVGPYLPDASIWPLVIGVGAALALNGFILGWPYAVPGAVMVALGVSGFVFQGRHRT